MNKHTPGPWIADVPGMVATKAVGAEGWEICDIRADVSECDANAALIAAAPDLLEALEALSKSAPSACCSDFNHKAGDFHEHDEACPPLDRYEAACLAARAAIAKSKGEHS